VPGGQQHGVQRIADGALEPTALHAPVAFHVADHRFDGRVALELTIDGSGVDVDAASLPGAEDPYTADLDPR
jgi:hypothetical protein